MGDGSMSTVSVLVVMACLLQCASAQTRHVVGDSLGWLVPPRSSAAYSRWASTQTFILGDTLVFNFATGAHDVAKVTKRAFDSCNPTNPISRLTNSPATFTLDSAGEHFFFCTFSQHCTFGQKLAINVSASSTVPSASLPASSPAPSPVATTPEAAGPSPSRVAETYIVGDQMGWLVPPFTAGPNRNPIFNIYVAWASNKTFNVGDTLVFNFLNGVHSVAEVTKAAYDACTTTGAISLQTTSPARIILDSQGEHYFICTYGQHCQFGGQKLAINVSSTTTTRRSSSQAPTAGGPTLPPPSSSSPSSTVAGFFVTFLSITAAFLF